MKNTQHAELNIHNAQEGKKNRRETCAFSPVEICLIWNHCTDSVLKNFHLNLSKMLLFFLYFFFFFALFSRSIWCVGFREDHSPLTPYRLQFFFFIDKTNVLYINRLLLTVKAATEFKYSCLVVARLFHLLRKGHQVL